MIWRDGLHEDSVAVSSVSSDAPALALTKSLVFNEVLRNLYVVTW